MKKNIFFVVTAALIIAVCSASWAGTANYVPGDVLVVFKGEEGKSVTASSLNMGSDAFRVASIATSAGACVAETYPALSESGNSVFAHLHSDIRTTEELVEEFGARDDVIAVSPNYIARVAVEPNDPIRPSKRLWGLDAIGAPKAWDSVKGRSDVYVAVIDTGVDYTNPDLKSNVDMSLSRNFTTSDKSAFMDDNGHGTHVAGTIGAAGNNGIGLVGVNWNVKIIALKATGADGSGYVSDIIKAIDYLTELVNGDPDFKLAALNMSLAIYASLEPTADNLAKEPLWRAMKALDRTNRTVTVVAAGNEGLEVGAPAPRDDTSDKRAYKKGNYAFPASFKGLNNMLSVSALDKDMSLANFSNYNASIAAPGVDIVSTFSQTSLSAEQDEKYKAETLDDGTRIGTGKGTSMASPHVAGAAALLLAADTSRTAYQITAALLNGNRGSVKTASGEGILDLTGTLAYQTEHKDLEREHARDAYDKAYERHKDDPEDSGVIGSSSGCDTMSFGAGLPMLLALLPLIFGPAAFAAKRASVLAIFKNDGTAKITAASVRDGSESLRMAGIAASAGARVATCYDALSEAVNGDFVLLESDTKTEEELLAELRARPDVLSVCPNYEVHLAGDVTPNDAMFGQQWGMKAINAPAAWGETTGKNSVYVAVIDTGIEPSHPDLSANVDTKLSHNFYPSGGASDYGDMQGHGTHVSGIIGAVGNNRVGVAGLSWKAKIITLRVFKGKTTNIKYVVEALNYIKGVLDSNPDLNLAAVNMSLTFNSSNSPSQMTNSLIWNAFSAIDKTNRAVIVVAAGNDHGLEIGKPSKGEYIYPASFEGLNNMIVVGSVDSDGSFSDFSNYSASKVHIAAPGGNIVSTYPHSINSSGYTSINGTSQAVPHVSGTAALIRALYPNATPQKIKAAILNGASSSSALQGKVANGLLNVKGALDYMAGRKNSGGSGGSSNGGSSENKSSGGGGGCEAVVCVWLLLPVAALALNRKSGR